MCWITGGHLIHPHTEELLPPGTELKLFQNYASIVAGLQVDYCLIEISQLFKKIF